MRWLLLLGAILSEVVGTSALKASQGFTRLGPSIVVVVGYLLSFYLLSLALKLQMPVSVGYALWSGIGTALIAAIGVVWLNEPMTALKALGIGLIIAGAVVLNFSGTH
ncbi:MAG: QacE family quaternary ammonium compound efflux SMR transporter [Streptosporangiales bacterium]|nr:QacE family quaternary ammonium compound efflux SMR transporter [Streptosporangiales bacterium]